jgi:PTH1 family peptidyl-tRNA hydrolase
MAEKRQLQLVVGLGNPGARYVKNRHNVGFMVVERLAARASLDFKKHPGRALVAQGPLGRDSVVLAKPQTFMNLSGFSVSALVHWFHIDVANNLLVVHDDLDLPLGKMRLRPTGGDGGHKGMASIIEQLRTQDFCRLRVGIGRPEFEEPFQYVLEDFTPEQWSVMDPALNVAADAVEFFLVEGIAAAMNRYNGS